MGARWLLFVLPLLLQLVVSQSMYTRTTTVTLVTCPPSTYSFETGLPSMSASPTGTCASLTICPGCQGQQYIDGDGVSYQVQCNRTFSGNVIAEGNNNSSGQKRSIQPSIQACLISCDRTVDCVGAVLTEETCTLFSSIDGVAPFPGAQGAIRSAYAASISALLSSTTSASGSSVTNTPFSSQLSEYISDHLSDGSPVSTSSATFTDVTDSISSSSSSQIGKFSSQLSEHVSNHLSEDSPISTSLVTGADTTFVSTPTISGPQQTTVSQASSSEESPLSTSSTSVIVGSSISTTASGPSQTLPTADSSNGPGSESSTGMSLTSDMSTFQSTSTTSPIASSQFSGESSSSSSSTPFSSLASDPAASTSTSSSNGTSQGQSSSRSSESSGILSSSSDSSSSSSTSSSTSSSPSDSTSSITTTSTFTIVTSETSSTTSSAVPTPVPNDGKRGLSYNQANLTMPYSLSGQNSRVSWAYDWFYQACPVNEPSCGFNPAIQFIPLLYSNAPDLLSEWPTAAQAAIDAGTPALMSFNEPDVCFSGSACMSVEASVQTYQQYMQPFAGRALLGAPAVTNGGSPFGLTYLSWFMGNCTGCTFDFINVHWYSNNYAGASYFEFFVNQTREIAQGRPIWVTEFGLNNENPYTNDELIAFLQTVMPWLDQQSDVARYAYFMNAPGILISSAGTGLSDIGLVYNNFTNATIQLDLF